MQQCLPACAPQLHKRYIQLSTQTAPLKQEGTSAQHRCPALRRSKKENNQFTGSHKRQVQIVLVQQECMAALHGQDPYACVCVCLALCTLVGAEAARNSQGGGGDR